MLTGVFWFAALHSGLAADSPDRVLTTVAEVRGLSAAEADRHLPVKLRGSVTFYDEALYSRFVQDETAGIYLRELPNLPLLLPGQTVEVEGVTGPGEYAPVVLPTSVKVIGDGKLPAAKPVSLVQLVSGREDSQWVEFSGPVRAVHFEKDIGYYLIDFVNGGERFTAYTKQLPVAQAQELVDATVKVRGVSATMFNHQRQLFGIRLLVPQADGLVIEKSAPANPFAMSAQKINSLLQFTPEGAFGDRIKAAGTVTYAEPGRAVFIEAENAGLYCQTLQRDALQLGDQVEVLGFPAKGGYTPILEDAVFQKKGTGAEPKADLVDPNKILTGSHDCRLVQLEARVLERVERGLNQFLVLQANDFTFHAYLPQRVNDNNPAAIQNGSEVRVTGICMIERGNNWQAGDQWRAASFRLLLRSSKDVVVLRPPVEGASSDVPWLACAFGVVALGALTWVALLRKKIRQQTKTR